MVALADHKVASIREIWKKETDFSKWLASEDGLGKLGRELAIDDLELIGTEFPVGRFFADIVCKNPVTGSLVVIENQFRESNHEHLGKLLTYGFWLGASTMIWIMEEMYEEHRAALEQLNEETDSNMRFFGIEASLGRVVEISQGRERESMPYLRLIFASKPNEWVKESRIVRRVKLRQERSMRYWNIFFQKFNLPDGYSQATGQRRYNSFYFNVLNEDFIFIIGRAKSSRIAVTLRIQAKGGVAKEYFNLLEAEREAIEKQFGNDLRWEKMPDKAYSQISFYRHAEYKDEKDWPEQHAWLAENLSKFDEVFHERIQNLPDVESLLEEREADAEEDPAE